MPKMNSLNSEASILPRSMSAAFRRKDSSWARVIFSCFIFCPLPRFRLCVPHLLFERLPEPPGLPERADLTDQPLDERLGALQHLPGIGHRQPVRHGRLDAVQQRESVDRCRRLLQEARPETAPIRLVHPGQLNQGFEQLQAASPVAVLPVDRDQAGSDARGSEQRDPALPRQRLSRAGFSAVAQFVQTDPDRNPLPP